MDKKKKSLLIKGAMIGAAAGAVFYAGQLSGYDKGLRLGMAKGYTQCLLDITIGKFRAKED